MTRVEGVLCRRLVAKSFLRLLAGFGESLILCLTWRKLMSEKPTGSGYFAAGCGGLFVLAFLGTFLVKVDQLSPDWIMRGWLFFVAAILLWWGADRIQNGKPDRTVGQATIHLVIALVGTTVALLGLLKHTPNP